jgi:hypothetical protein
MQVRQEIVLPVGKRCLEDCDDFAKGASFERHYLFWQKISRK